MDDKHFIGTSIMNAVETASKEYGCGVDDLDYELIVDDKEKIFNDPDKPIEIIVYGVIENYSKRKSNNFGSLPIKDPSTLTEEEFDFIADTTTDTIRDILKYFDADDVEIDEYEGDEGEIILDIVGDDLAYLIGRHGKTLDALQFLVTSITNKKLGYRVPVTVDVEGYKGRRRDKIGVIANNAASKAIKQHNPVSLRPMTPYERRIVHLTLKNNHKVETYSEGVDPQRHVIIKPK